MNVEPYRPDREEYFMGFAEWASVRSKDSTKVGAALVGPDGELRLTGHNGPPMGVEDKPERFEHPVKYLFASHAEANVISFAARQGIRTNGCTLYVTHHPCADCAKAAIQAGITRIVFGPGKTRMPCEHVESAKTMFCEAGVAAEAFGHTTPVADALNPTTRALGKVDTKALVKDLVVECNRAVMQAKAQGEYDTCFGVVLDKHGIK